MVARDERESSDSNGLKLSDTTNAGAAMGEEQEVPMAQSAATRTQQQLQQVESATESPQTSRTQTQTQTLTQTAVAANLSSLLTPLCTQADLLLKGVHIALPY